MSQDSNEILPEGPFIDEDMPTDPYPDLTTTVASLNAYDSSELIRDQRPLPTETVQRHRTAEEDAKEDLSVTPREEQPTPDGSKTDLTIKQAELSERFRQLAMRRSMFNPRHQPGPYSALGREMALISQELRSMKSHSSAKPAVARAIKSSDALHARPVRIEAAQEAVAASFPQQDPASENPQETMSLSKDAPPTSSIVEDRYRAVVPRSGTTKPSRLKSAFGVVRDEFRILMARGKHGTATEGDVVAAANSTTLPGDVNYASLLKSPQK